MNREAFFAWVLQTLSGFLSIMPVKWRYPMARMVGRLSRFGVPGLWQAVGRNLDILNRWGNTNKQPHQVFENFSMTLADFLRVTKPTFEVKGREKAEMARAKGKGVIFFTSHLGHWEMGAQILVQWGWPVTAVYQPYKSRRLQTFIQTRRTPELNYVAVGNGAAQGVSQVLQKRGTVAFLGDRPFGEKGLPVHLFGRRMFLPRGPFILACRFGAPIVPGFVLRHSPGHYQAVVEDPLWPQGKNQEAVLLLLKKTAKILEGYIANHGDQWFCFEPLGNGQGQIPLTQDPGV